MKAELHCKLAVRATQDAGFLKMSLTLMRKYLQPCKFSQTGLFKVSRCLRFDRYGKHFHLKHL